MEIENLRYSGHARYLERSSMDSDVEDEESVVCLREEDVPGASLGGREVASLKVPELRRWLQCRRASVKGKKADLVARYGNYASL